MGVYIASFGMPIEQWGCSCGEFTRGSLWREKLWSCAHDETALDEAGRFVYTNQNGR
jgi:hypothetical protein